MAPSRRHLRAMTDEEAFDPYQLEDASHDPAAFYVYCGKDSSPIQTRVPTEYVERIGALVARREIPEYQTPADFIRDAIHHRLYWYANHYSHPEIADQMDVFTHLERSKERQRAAAARRDVIVQLRAEFSEAWAARLPRGCQEALDAVNLALAARDSDDDTYKRELTALAREFESSMRSL